MPGTSVVRGWGHPGGQRPPPPRGFPRSRELTPARPSLGAWVPWALSEKGFCLSVNNEAQRQLRACDDCKNLTLKPRPFWKQVERALKESTGQIPTRQGVFPKGGPQGLSTCPNGQKSPGLWGSTGALKEVNWRGGEGRASAEVCDPERRGGAAGTLWGRAPRTGWRQPEQREPRCHGHECGHNTKVRWGLARAAGNGSAVVLQVTLSSRCWARPFRRPPHLPGGRKRSLGSPAPRGACPRTELGRGLPCVLPVFRVPTLQGVALEEAPPECPPPSWTGRGWDSSRPREVPKPSELGSGPGTRGRTVGVARGPAAPAATREQGRPLAVWLS